MKNKKGIDWSKKDMYEGIGRPDLRIDDGAIKTAINALECLKYFLQLEKGSDIYNERIDKQISEIERAIKILEENNE